MIKNNILNDIVYCRKIDKDAKEKNLTIVYAPWHITPEFRVFKTGTLLSRNSEYPSGLIILDKINESDYDVHSFPYEKWRKIYERI